MTPPTNGWGCDCGSDEENFEVRASSSAVELQTCTAFGSAGATASALLEFKSECVTLRERADFACVLVTAAVDGGSLSDAIGVAAGVELLPGAGATATGSATGRTALWLSPRCWLIHCAADEERALAEGINRISPEKLVHAVPFTDALCWLELSGPGGAALELLTEGGFVSLEQGGLAVGRAKRTLIAQIAAIVIHQTESLWLLGVERSRARYFVQWLAAAAA
jgi:heterotetrameric sarcosine oxidase gamma subunit